MELDLPAHTISRTRKTKRSVPGAADPRSGHRGTYQAARAAATALCRDARDGAPAKGTLGGAAHISRPCAHTTLAVAGRQMHTQGHETACEIQTETAT